jgi:flagellar protein FlaG
MNYDLFVLPQTVERAAPLPLSSAARDVVGGTRKAVRPSGGTEAEAVTFPADLHEEVSSDEHRTEQVRQAVKMINRMLDRSPVDVNMSIDDGSGSLVIKLIERQSRKVIRQIPPDEILRLRRHLQELLGVIFDETA